MTNRSEQKKISCIHIDATDAEKLKIDNKSQPFGQSSIYDWMANAEARVTLPNTNI